MPHEPEAVKSYRAQGAADQFEPAFALYQVVDAPDNPRKSVGDVTELAESIREHGLIHPLVVTPRVRNYSCSSSVEYLLVAGHRRKAALVSLGATTAPVIIREMNEVQRVTAMLVENCQRTDLTVGEEAESFRTLEGLGMSQREIAQRTGRSQGHVSKRLALLSVPEMLPLIDADELDVQVAIELVKLSPKYQKKALAEVRTGRFDKYALKRWQATAEREEAIEARKTTAKAAGYKVLGVASQVIKTKHWRLGTGWGELALDAVQHAKLPCHAVIVDWDGKSTIPCCTDRAKHPEVKTRGEAQEGTEERKAKEAKEAAQREAAKKSRHAALSRALKAMGEKEALELVGLHMLDQLGVTLKDVGQVLGIEVDDEDELEEELVLRLRERPSEARRTLVAMVAAHIEVGFDRSWYAGGAATKAYLSFLERNGHKLTKAEKAMAQ